MIATITQRVFPLGILILCLCGWTAQVQAGPQAPPEGNRRRPNVEFDDEKSPLQGAMIDARDKKWLKKSGAGSDARCSRVIKALSQDPQDQRTIDKLCVNESGDPLDDSRECLEKYCENADCADALVAGNESLIDSECQVPEEDKKCARALFSQSRRAVECLEDPYDDQGDFKPRCRQLFDDCDDLAVMRRTKKEALSGKIKNSNGRQVGRRIETETVIRYENPKRRGKAGEAKDKWDPIRIGNARIKQRHIPAGRNDHRTTDHGNRVRSAGLLIPNCDDDGNCDGTLSINNDEDCIDEVTGEHKRGTGGCFDDLGNLLATLEVPATPCEVESADGTISEVECCRHTNGTIFYGNSTDSIADDCWDDQNNLRTTLRESIDEDPVDFINDDGDCLDSSGIVTSLCTDENGILHSGYQWQVDEETCGDGINNDNDCMLEDGTITMDCMDDDGNIREDVLWLVDEDCADAIDNDGDGLVDEDGPELPLPNEDEEENDKEVCRAFYRAVGLQARGNELPNADQECDLSRAMVVHVNKEAKAHPDHGGLNFFKATDEGDPDPDGEGDIEIGKEERRVTIREVFAAKCKPIKVPSDTHPRGWVWEDTHFDEDSGTCILDETQLSSLRKTRRGQAGSIRNQPGSARKRAVTKSGTTARSTFPSATGSTADEEATCSPPDCGTAMMGFTFAPPVLEWGVRIKEEVCIFGFCIEIFYARIGYEFDLAAGLRLPVDVSFDGIPESVLAEDPVELAVSLTPRDFSVRDYREFCERHDLDDDWFISDCERFAFPDFLDSLLPIPRDEMDGDEFVAHYSIFAGIVVRLFYIPLINWAVDSSVDVPAICTMFKIKDQIEGVSLMDIVKLGISAASADSDRELLEVIKGELANCGTFTTPFGVDSDTGELRSFPFLNASFSVRADCADAILNNEFITIGKKKRPMCTGLILGTAGASLGVGLGVEATAGSRLITSDWSTSGDAAPAGEELSFTRSADETDSTLPITITADNWDDRPVEDYARIALDDFTYYLNAMQIKLSANLEFGGILSPIPDIGSFTLYNFIFDTGRFGIPIPQHPGTSPIEVPIFVENYGTEVDVATTPGDPNAVDHQTLQIKPGETGDYQVKVTNIGSVPGDFDNFVYELSNRPYQVTPGNPSALVLFIDANTDHDCKDSLGNHYTLQDPYDGRADDCYEADGTLRSDRTDQGLIDEDPPGCNPPRTPCESKDDRDDDGDGIADEDPVDGWVAVFNPEVPLLEGVPAHSLTPLGQTPTIAIGPFRHPLTKPGIYAFRVMADSVEAKEFGLSPIDPSQNHRVAAPDVAFVEVLAFYDPLVVTLPFFANVLPGTPQSYTVEGTNGSNVDDAMDIGIDYLDFNRAGCTLVNMGFDPDCPYRAVPTVIPSGWIVGTPPIHFPAPPEPPVGELMTPLEVDTSAFTVDVPSDWAGMVNTTYQFLVTATSVTDPDDPSASNSFVAEHTVNATLESQTRFIGLEIQALIDEIVAANSRGTSTGGLLPIALHPVQMMNQRALDRVLAGNPDAAMRTHRSNIRTTEAFIRALDGYGGDGRKIDVGRAANWRTRAEAIIGDLNFTVGGDAAAAR